MVIQNCFLYHSNNNTLMDFYNSYRRKIGRGIRVQENNIQGGPKKSL